MLTVDRLAATAVTGREIAALEHEVRDDAVERAPLHMKTQPPVNTSPALRRCTAEFLQIKATRDDLQPCHEGAGLLVQRYGM
jgi:hypothetical protein